jgi:hypothetical protein
MGHTDVTAYGNDKDGNKDGINNICLNRLVKICVYTY